MFWGLICYDWVCIVFRKHTHMLYDIRWYYTCHQVVNINQRNMPEFLTADTQYHEKYMHSFSPVWNIYSLFYLFMVFFLVLAKVLYLSFGALFNFLAWVMLLRAVTHFIYVSTERTQ